MKIGYVTMQFPVPSETFASLDVRTLEAKQNEVYIFAMRPKHPNFDSMVAERLHNSNKIFHFNLSSLLLSLRSIISNPLLFISISSSIVYHCYDQPKHLIKSFILLPSAFYIFEKIKATKPDVVHLFWGHYPSLVAVLLHKAKFRLPITMFLGAHDLERHFPLSRVASEYTGRVFTHSHENVPQIINLGVPRNLIEVVYRGTTIPLNIDRTSKEGKRIKIVTAARLIPEKGVEEVIKAVSILKRENNLDIKLIVAGGGPERPALEKLSLALDLEKEVCFLGHINQAELFKILESSTFFVLMSRYKSERLPNVIKEAMVRGIVCVTTKSKGIEELIIHGENGLIVNGRSELVEAIVWLGISSHEYKRISENAIVHVKRNFDVDRNMQRYINCWKSL